MGWKGTLRSNNAASKGTKKKGLCLWDYNTFNYGHNAINMLLWWIGWGIIT